MTSKKDSMQGLKNLQELLDAHKQGVKICWIDRGYYNLDTVISAFQDIQVRQKLGALTKSDELLLSFICFSITPGTK